MFYFFVFSTRCVVSVVSLKMQHLLLNLVQATCSLVEKESAFYRHGGVMEHSVGYTTTGRDRGISVLNNCREWDKFIRLTLTYPTPDSRLTYTKLVTCSECCRRTLNRKEQLRHRAVSLRQHCFLVVECP